MNETVRNFPANPGVWRAALVLSLLALLSACGGGGSGGSSTTATIYAVDSPIAYNGVNTRLTVYATNISPPVSSIAIVPAGLTSPVTTLQTSTNVSFPDRADAIIPSSTPAGVYDVIWNDQHSAPAKKSGGLRVTSTLGISVTGVTPNFGNINADTNIVISSSGAFTSTPRAFLSRANPGASDIAVALNTIFQDANTLTALVPAGALTAGSYDLVVINPDGTTGMLANAFLATSAAAPVIDKAVPSSVINSSGQNVVLSGTNFSTSTISLACHDANGTTVTAPTVTSGAPACSGSNCTQSASFDASGLAAGTVCVARLTNSDGSYFDYSAIGITGPTLNLNSPHAGTSMNIARRALVAASGEVSSNAANLRYVYAIGGDGGAANAASPFKSIEFAPVDQFGNLGAWSTARYALGTPRSFAGSSVVGRYIYVFGGSDGANILSTAERSMILSSTEAPRAGVNDLLLGSSGLGAGYWYYRVSAVFALNDPDNPGGESLPSSELVVSAPSVTGQKVQPEITWQAPVDVSGNPLPNVSGYRIYRTLVANGAAGGEVLLATVSNVLTYLDNGSATPGTATPLPTGSLGAWTALPSMGSARKGAASASAADPATANAYYVYALLGQNTPTTALASYEYLPVTVQDNGHQTVGSWTAGASTSAAARWQLGTWAADNSVSSNITAGSTYIYLGGGVAANGTTGVNTVEAGLVAAGGDLGTLAGVTSFAGTVAGYGVCAANNQLFAFGGANLVPSSGAIAATLGASPPVLDASWNSASLTLVQSRYLLGSSQRGTFVFLVGGQDGVNPASRTTEMVVW